MRTPVCQQAWIEIANPVQFFLYEVFRFVVRQSFLYVDPAIHFIYFTFQRGNVVQNRFYGFDFSGKNPDWYLRRFFSAFFTAFLMSSVLKKLKSLIACVISSGLSVLILFVVCILLAPSDLSALLRNDGAFPPFFAFSGHPMVDKPLWLMYGGFEEVSGCCVE